MFGKNKTIRIWNACTTWKTQSKGRVQFVERKRKFHYFWIWDPFVLLVPPIFQSFGWLFAPTNPYKYAWLYRLVFFFSWNEVVAEISDTTLCLIIVSAPHSNGIKYPKLFIFHKTNLGVVCILALHFLISLEIGLPKSMKFLFAQIAVHKIEFYGDLIRPKCISTLFFNRFQLFLNSGEFLKIPGDVMSYPIFFYAFWLAFCSNKSVHTCMKLKDLWLYF